MTAPRAARETLDGLSTMAAGVSHDFNNFLTAILGNAVIVQRSPALRDADAAHAMRIASTAREAIDLANAFLLFSGRGQVERARMNLGTLVRRMTCQFKSMAPKGGSVRTRIAPHLPPCEVNADLIRRSLLNLVENAADALGDTRGTIRISLAVQRVAEGGLNGYLLGESCLPGRYVRIAVSDTGRGMTRRIRTRMFHPFFSTKIRGRGMGLTTVFGAVRSHRGALDVESRPRQGTTVTLCLPCSAA
jgi:two-component system, cell cycle sensor histidine kinase and response regulator CckA